MLDRRKLLQSMLASGILGPKLAHAGRPLGGIREIQIPFRFHNATVLDANGMIERNWGGEVIDGQLRLSKSITDGDDLNGKWIVPNFIDAGCTVGLYEVGMESATRDDSESNASEQPLLIPADGFNPLSEVIPTVRANGVGTVLLHPSLDRLVAGSISVMQLAGLTRADTTLAKRAAICIGLGGAGKGHDGPSTRMGIAVRLREIFAEMSSTPEVKKKWWKKEEESPELEGEDALWRDVADGKLPVVFRAHRADDIELAIDLIEEFTLSGIVLGGAEAWIHAKRLAVSEIPILLGPLTIQPSSFEHLYARYDNAKLLHDAGVIFAFRSGKNHNSRQIPTEAAVAVAHGLPFEVAIQALCKNASTIFSLERPYLITDSEPVLANFFVCEGDPLQPRNSIERMWVSGQECDLRSKQTDLYEIYKNLD